MSQPGDDVTASMLVSLLHARDTEAARVSRVLHDDVGQVLTAVGLQLDALRMEFIDRVPEIGPRAVEIQVILEHAVQRVRDLSYELNPDIVERAGLHFAMDRLVGRFRSNFSGSIRLLTDSSVRPPAPVGAAIYKIAEHALENAVLHSQGNRIEVHLREAHGTFLFEVRDNGVGMPDGPPPPLGLGLRLMQALADKCGLSFGVKTTPGKGTIITSKYKIGTSAGSDPGGPPEGS